MIIVASLQVLLFLEEISSWDPYALIHLRLCSQTLELKSKVNIQPKLYLTHTDTRNDFYEGYLMNKVASWSMKVHPPVTHDDIRMTLLFISVPVIHATHGQIDLLVIAERI